MSQRVKELTNRFKTFNNEVIGFVESCSDDKWRKKGKKGHLWMDTG